MKIYYITNNRIPTEKANGLQIVNMCKAFAGYKDIELQLIIPYRENKINEDLFTYYDIEANFSVKRIKTGLPAYYGFLNKVFFWLSRFIFLIKLLFINFSDKSVVYSRQPDIAFITSKLKNVTSVYEDHGWPNSKVWLYKYLTRRINYIVTITEGIKNKYKENNFDTSNILVAHDGVDIEKFNINLSKKEARKRLNLPTEKRIATYTGSFFRYEWKGVDLILEAAQDLQKYLFLLVGGTSEEIKKIESEYNLKNVILKEHVSHSKIPTFLKASDLLLLPNKSDNLKSEKYTSPLKLFEYMASNRPILASDIPSLREVLSQNNSFIFEANNVTKLRKKIKEVFKKPNLSKQKAKKAKKDANKYSWDNRARKILNSIR